jgi:hypothetical protein
MIPWCLPTKEITYLTGRNFPFTKFNPKHSLVCESTLREQLSQKLRPGHPWVTLSSFLPNIRSRNICKICRQGRESPGSTNWNAFTILVLRSFVGIQITNRQNVDIQITDRQNADIKIVDKNVDINYLPTFTQPELTWPCLINVGYRLTTTGGVNTIQHFHSFCRPFDGR